MSTPVADNMSLVRAARYTSDRYDYYECPICGPIGTIGVLKGKTVAVGCGCGEHAKHRFVELKKT
jgi:hypothetical protein